MTGPLRIAINGAGVAGPALAWWLRHYGHRPLLFETAPSLRTGGYIVDFWGSGYAVAEKMGLLPGLLEDGYIIEHMRNVTASGRTAAAFDGRVFQRLTDGRYLSIARSDLSRRVWQACEGIETRFGTAVTGFEARGEALALRLSDGSLESVDLLVGADGLHSQVRALAFGPEAQFERQLGFYVAAFTLPGYRPRDELSYILHSLPGRQISRVALRGDLTLFLFIFTRRFVAAEPQGAAETRALLRATYRDMGWEADAILARLDEVDEIYFDRVSQIRMPEWCKGRVALIGDAAACVSLLAGEGTGLAMTEAYVLAGELHRAGGGHAAAFAAYQARLQPYLAKKQAAALKFAGFFAPKSWPALIARDLFTNLAAIPFLTRPLLAGSLGIGFELPAYDAGQQNT